MFRKSAAAALALSIAAMGQAWAADAAPATLAGLKGQVMISRAGSVTPASAGALKAGDRIVARSGGQASLRYADGCVIQLKSQAMATIGATSPCASGQGLVKATSGDAAQTAAAPPPGGLSILQIAGIGLTAVVLAVGLAAAADDVSLSN